MKSFMKWNGKSVEDCGSYMSKEATSFVTAFRNMLKRELNPYGIEVVYLKPNHYDCSGFVKKEDHYIYISYSIPRYGSRIDFKRTGFADGVLYRTAKHEKDYRGGNNNFSNIESLPGAITSLFSRMESGLDS